MIKTTKTQVLQTAHELKAINCYSKNYNDFKFTTRLFAEKYNDDGYNVSIKCVAYSEKNDEVNSALVIFELNPTEKAIRAYHRHVIYYFGDKVHTIK